MATPYKLITKQTVGAGGAASVTFSNIPQTYTDLRIFTSVRNTSSGNSFQLSFNGSTADFSNVRLYANGSSAVSYSGSDVFIYANTSSQTGGTFNNAEIYIPNYRSSNSKSISIDTIAENKASSTEMSLIAGIWSQTAAITSIGFTPYSGTFAEHTTFHLYGISNS